MASRALYPLFKAFDSAGALLNGGKLWSYDPGTTNLRSTWTDAAATVAHTNPIILDSVGEAEVFISGNTKFILTDSADVQIWSKDSIIDVVSSITSLSAVAGTDTITATAATPPSAYAANQRWSFIAAATNTGAVTLNISALGARSITKNGATALAAGDIQSGAIILVEDDGTRLQALDFNAASLSGATFTGAINTARATVASNATTSAIWAALGNEIDFTGTATVTDFPAAPQAGASRVLHIAGLCTFTHSATLDIDGNIDHVAAVGDIVRVHALTTTTFRLEVVKQDGTAVAGGKILQVVNATYGTLASSSSSTFADTGLTATITPSSATSKILAIVNMSGCGKNTNGTSLALKLVRGATTILNFEDSGGSDGGSALNAHGGEGCNFLDSPATISATTYKVQFASTANNAIVYAQRWDVTSGNSNSSITLMEISA